MPRLSDLLSDKLKSRLFAEAQKKAPAAKTRRPFQTEKLSAAPAVPLPDFIAIDVETTGLDFSSDRIIEVGAVKFTGGKPREAYSSLVKPGVPLPPAITDLTGIAEADVAGAPVFAEIAPTLLAFLGGLPLCGHQIDFDLTFLNKELERAGQKPIASLSLDTVLLSRILLQSGTRFSLQSVSDSLDVALDTAHRASSDARASGEIANVLIPKISQLPLHVRQTMAAAAPASFLKSLIFKSLGTAPPGVKLKTLPALPSSNKLSVPETYREIDSEEIKKNFLKEGALERCMPSFSPRKSQLDMALSVTSALNTQSILVAEAGTGTGKSLAYLLPAAFWALKNNTRILVASRTRNLQDQLISKELPLIFKILGRQIPFQRFKGPL